jgi:hypothetical protein
MLAPASHRCVALAAGLCAVLAIARPARALAPPYLNEGRRWIGSATVCKAPSEWRAERLFSSPQLPSELASLCLYTWLSRTAPGQDDLDRFAVTAAATGLAEDVPVLAPSAPFSVAERHVAEALRANLRAQVGDASLLPAIPAVAAARVVVIDSAPDARAGAITPGASRHGDTLAHLIEDLVCVTGINGRRCAAEVTTALALPYVAPSVYGSHGGYTGSLGDLAGALDRALKTWEDDRASAPATTPAHLILNLSVGWEDVPGAADCTLDPRRQGLGASAVLGFLQVAAARGALIVAAAGNDSAGPKPRDGLLCPARYQAVPQPGAPTRSLVLAVSGTDYRDRPLENARPHGITGVAALGFGGVAWAPADDVPPPLTGSSVSAAVASAVGALVWAARPALGAAGVEAALYGGGIEVDAADQCPLEQPGCASRRVSVCGALGYAGLKTGCAVPRTRRRSSPSLAPELSSLAAQYAAVTALPAAEVVAESTARFLEPTRQVLPEVYPQPVSSTCPMCAAQAATTSQPGALLVPWLEQPLTDAALVVRLDDDTRHALALGPLLANTAYKYILPIGWLAQTAYLTGYDADGFSVILQIVVQP